MKIKDIGFTCYPVTDMNRARKFYEGTLGLVKAVHTEKEGFSWVEYNVGSSTLDSAAECLTGKLLKAVDASRLKLKILRMPSPRSRRRAVNSSSIPMKHRFAAWP